MAAISMKAGIVRKLTFELCKRDCGRVRQRGALGSVHGWTKRPTTQQGWEEMVTIEGPELHEGLTN